MPVTIQDNSAEWFKEFDKRCNKALEEIGDAVLERGPDETPVKTGATLNSEDKNVYPDEKRVEIGASTDYAPLIMTGNARRQSNPFLIRMLLGATAKIRRIMSGEGLPLDKPDITTSRPSLPQSIQDIKGYRPPARD
jgi:hypothetical protein